MEVDFTTLKPVESKKQVDFTTLKPVEPEQYHGKEAVERVAKQEGRELSLAERRVVEEEGFVDGTYKDDKGVETSGVGQTGKWKGMSFTETFKAHKEDARRLIDDFDTLPEELQAEFVQITYRGDLRGSPTAVKLFNEGKYEEASKELLDHKEYKERKAKGDDGVTRRLEALSKQILEYSNQSTP